MTGLSVTYHVRTGRDRHGRLTIAEGAAPGLPPAEPARRKRPPRPGTSKAARTLALAHHIERLIEAGVYGNYADAARRLGVSRARMSQIHVLLRLSPRTQEAVLMGADRRSEKALQRPANEPPRRTESTHQVGESWLQ
jgi:hypothetical protein